MRFSQVRVELWERQIGSAMAELQAKGEVPAEMGTQQGSTPKGWREKAKEWMQTGVEERFQPLMLEMHEGDEDIGQATVEKMTELRGDLIVLYDEGAPCFPPSYNVFAFYVFDNIIYCLSSNFIIYSFLNDSIKLTFWFHIFKLNFIFLKTNFYAYPKNDWRS